MAWYDSHLPGGPNWVTTTKFTSYLGSGAFGLVIKSEGTTESFQSAVKLILPKHFEDDKEKRKNQREFETLIGKRNKHVAQVGKYTEETLKLEDIAGFLPDPQTDKEAQKFQAKLYSRAKKHGSVGIICIKMELYGTTLRHWLTEVEESVEHLLLIQLGIVNGLISGLKYLHKQKILHRDLKPENIFFSYGSEKYLLPIKIGDFGLSREFDEDDLANDLSRGVGTPSYTAPEVALGNYSFPADLYSLGLIIWEVMYLIKDQRKLWFYEYKVEKKIDLVTEHAHVPNTQELILNLTKESVEQRVKTADEVEHLHAPEFDRASANNSKEFQIMLESCSQIELSKGEFQGIFELDREYVNIKGSGRETVIHCDSWITLEISGSNCSICNFTSLVSGSGVIGIVISGCNNKAQSILAHGGYHNIIITGNDNHLSRFQVQDTSNGIKIVGNANKLEDILLVKVLSVGVEIGGTDNQLDRVRCNTTSANDGWGLEATEECTNAKIFNSKCVHCKISGANNHVKNLDSRKLIEISGRGHIIENCTGVVCDAEEDGLLPVAKFINNRFQTYSKGLVLKKLLRECHDGDTIHLPEGIYLGHFTVEGTNIKIVGVGDLTVILGVEGREDAVLHIEKGNCSISNLHISASNYIVAGILITSSNNTIDNVSFNDCSIGAFVRGSNNHLSNLRIDDSYKDCLNKTSTKSDSPRYGLFVQGNKNMLKNIVYKNGHYNRDQFNGVFLSSGMFNVVTNLVCAADSWPQGSFGLALHTTSMSATVTDSNCVRVHVDGANHTFDNVTATDLFDIVGDNQAHSIKNCTLVPSYTETGKDTLVMPDSRSKPPENHISISKSLAISSSQGPSQHETRVINPIVKMANTSEELQTCLKTCNNHDIIQLGEGTFEIEGGFFLLFVTNVTIKGHGPSTMLINMSFKKDEKTFRIAGDSCTISNLKFIICGESLGLILSGCNNTVENVIFQGGYYSFAIKGDGNHITDVEFNDAFNGVVVSGNSNTFENIMMDNVADVGIWLNDSSFNKLTQIRFLNVKVCVRIEGDGNEVRGINFEKGNHGEQCTCVHIRRGCQNIIQSLKCQGMERWKEDYGLVLEVKSNHSQISDFTCERIRVRGKNQHFINVVCSEVFGVEGSSHRFEKCKAGKFNSLAESVDMVDCEFREELVASQ